VLGLHPNGGGQTVAVHSDGGTHAPVEAMADEAMAVEAMAVEAVAVEAVAVVLAGGAARRFGGGDKTAAPLGEGSVLDAVLAGLPAGLPALVVGPDVPGGPVAGLAAGLERARRRWPQVATLVVLAGDQPFAGPVVTRLLAALSSGPAGPAPADSTPAGSAAAVGLDPDGRVQPMPLAARVPQLAEAVRALGPEPAGRALRDLLAVLAPARVPISAVEALDVDTPADLERARRLCHPGGQDT
jgi:molybdopterin-guanine dinucleotide biosynthesis protein A